MSETLEKLVVEQSVILELYERKSIKFLRISFLHIWWPSATTKVSFFIFFPHLLDCYKLCNIISSTLINRCVFLVDIKLERMTFARLELFIKTIFKFLNGPFKISFIRTLKHLFTKRLEFSARSIIQHGVF